MKAWKEIGVGEKPYVIPTLYGNGTIGGSTFACACETGSYDAHKFFEGYFVAKSTYGDWIEWYYPMSNGCIVTGLQLDFTQNVTANGRLETRYNETWVTVGTFSVSNYYIVNVVFSDVQYYSQRYRLVFESCSPSDPTLMLYSITQKTLVDAYNMQKQLNVRHYYKYQYSTFTRPNLSADGEMGGSSFAVSANNYVSGFQVYKAVDGNNSTGWEVSSPTTAYYIFYNPIELNVSEIKMRNWTGSGNIDASKGGKVYGSNDNSNWTELKTYTNTVYSSGGEWTIDLSSNTNYYKYYKITCTDGTSNNRSYWCVAEMTPYGTIRTVTEGTASDYDFYRDENAYYAFTI